MRSPAAILVDVYDTVLHCDFAGHRQDIPALAGVPEGPWMASFHGMADQLSDGRLSLKAGYAAMLTQHGIEQAELAIELVRLDFELLRDNAVVYPDTRPFLAAAREAGLRIAFVSNCMPNTRPLLKHLGLLGLVDAAALSNEVGAVKPSAGIYQAAMGALGVTADQCCFIDDQKRFCEGATTLGITAFRIEREATSADAVGSFDEIARLLDL